VKYKTRNKSEGETINSKEQEGIRIQNDKFYVLVSKDVKWIYTDERQAVKALKDLLAMNENSSPGEVSLVEASIAGQEWEIKQVPWSRITLLLIREGK